MPCPGQGGTTHLESHEADSNDADDAMRLVQVVRNAEVVTQDHSTDGQDDGNGLQCPVEMEPAFTCMVALRGLELWCSLRALEGW